MNARTAPSHSPRRRSVLGMHVHGTSYAHAVNRIVAWAARGESRYICMGNVHMTMEAVDSANFRAIVNAADLVTPDGMPLVWALRLLGVPGAERVYGPDLTLRVCRRAAAERVPVGFYGGERTVLERLVSVLKRRFPELIIAFAESPPFRPLNSREEDDVVRRIRAAGPRILFVGLGCPKQERWMATHRGSIPAVMLGVGAAFDFLAGAKPRAPRWLQRAGLEWLFRLSTEPRRLRRRYLVQNPRFIARFSRQLARTQHGDRE